MANEKVKIIQVEINPMGDEPINPKYGNRGLRIPEIRFKDFGFTVPHEEVKPDLPFTWEVPFFLIGKEGYIESIRFSENGFVPPVEPGDNKKGNEIVEMLTYCLVKISRVPDAAVDVEEFRILYAQPTLTGEKLSTAMAVVAALKDAFVHRNKVRIYFEKARYELHFGRVHIQSDEYKAIKAVELVAR